MPERGRVRFEAATSSHVAELLPRLRSADWQEVAASSVLPVGHALVMSVARGNAEVGLIDNEAVVLFGAAPIGMINRAATPWMVGSNKLERYPITVLRHNRRIIDRWTSQFDHLFNYVDTRNEVSKKWLKWLGFKLHDPRPYGPLGLDFHKFEWRR
ncbi:MAG: hypothetical protein AAFX02_11145 [Pseudomonadota bacterium]